MGHDANFVIFNRAKQILQHLELIQISSGSPLKVNLSQYFKISQIFITC